MHEYSIARALVERVEREAVLRGATSVRRLEVTVGELAGVEAAFLATAFEHSRTGTACSDANLQLTSVAARWECRACGHDIPRGRPLACPECGGLARLVAGGELRLERIEMEVA